MWFRSGTWLDNDDTWATKSSLCTLILSCFIIWGQLFTLDAAPSKPRAFILIYTRRFLVKYLGGIKCCNGQSNLHDHEGAYVSRVAQTISPSYAVQKSMAYTDRHFATCMTSLGRGELRRISSGLSYDVQAKTDQGGYKVWVGDVALFNNSF